MAATEILRFAIIIFATAVSYPVAIDIDTDGNAYFD